MNFSHCNEVLSNEELQLKNRLVTQILQMTLSLDNISSIGKKLNIPNTTIKQECQTERLLNTKKFEKFWSASIDDCKKHWNK